MPFSPENPHRDRNFVILVIGFIALVTIVMAGWLYTDAGGRDTGSYEKFLILLFTTLPLGILSVWYSFKANRTGQEVGQRVEQVVQQTNGAMDRRIEEAVERRLSATGQTPQAGQSVNDRYGGITDQDPLQE